MVYFSLPFHNVPTTRLLYASYQHGNSLGALHAQCDGVGPTVVLAKSGEFVSFLIGVFTAYYRRYLAVMLPHLGTQARSLLERQNLSSSLLQRM
jgi:hypothetical protein